MVDHGRNGNDDHANVLVGAMYLAIEARLDDLAWSATARFLRWAAMAGIIHRFGGLTSAGDDATW